MKNTKIWRFAKNIAIMQVLGMALLCFMASCSQKSKVEHHRPAETHQTTQVTMQ